jgi:hypothetical protein
MLNQRELPYQGIENAFCQVQHLLFDRYSSMYLFLAFELSISKNLEKYILHL